MNENLTQKIKRNFDRLALYSGDEWNHNNYYHQFLLGQLPEHSQTILDLGYRYLTYLQAKEIYISFFKTAKVRRHLFWRYSVVWQKPIT